MSIGARPGAVTPADAGEDDGGGAGPPRADAPAGARPDASRGVSRDPLRDVHRGRDGWLFLVGGSNRALDQYRPTLRQGWRTARWARLVRNRIARAQALGLRSLHVVVPEKLAIYDSCYDGDAPDPMAGPAARLAARLAREGAGGRYLDLIPLLRAEREAHDLYLRTDTHWSFEGCALAYQAICRALGAVPRPDLAERPAFPVPYLGDLGAKLVPAPPPERAVRRDLLRDARRVAASEPVLRCEREGRPGAIHVDAHVVYRNDAAHADPRRVLMFGDSYANFVLGQCPGALTPMLAETFREFHFVWSTSIDWRHVARLAPDVLLFEVAERFTARLPRDDARPVAPLISES